MTRLVLGRNWELATPTQQKLPVDRFSALLIHGYAAASAGQAHADALQLHRIAQRRHLYTGWPQLPSELLHHRLVAMH